MKKSILTLTIITLIAGTISTAYGLQPVKTSLNTLDIKQETKINMVAAKPDLMETGIISFAENRKFLKDSEIKITSNKKSFADFKVILSAINNKENAPCQEQVNKLEQTNTSMKNKLDNHKKNVSQNRWTYFKRQFNQDMDKLEVKMWSVK
jgi:hypothetical protein